jgi:hypothetical protein
MLDVNKVRGGKGLDPIVAEVDEILQSVFDITKEATQGFFVSFDRNPNPIALATWLETRAWREIDYVYLLNEQIRRYGMRFTRRHIMLLAKQAFQEELSPRPFPWPLFPGAISSGNAWIGTISPRLLRGTHQRRRRPEVSSLPLSAPNGTVTPKSSRSISRSRSMRNFTPVSAAKFCRHMPRPTRTATKFCAQ